MAKTNAQKEERVELPSSMKDHIDKIACKLQYVCETVTEQPVFSPEAASGASWILEEAIGELRNLADESTANTEKRIRRNLWIRNKG